MDVRLLCLFCVVWVVASATGWSLLQRSLAGSLCLIVLGAEWATMRQLIRLSKLGCWTIKYIYINLHIATDVRPDWRNYPGTFLEDWRISLKTSVTIFTVQTNRSSFFPVALRPNTGHGLLILRFLDHTQRRTTVGRTPLWSARRRDLYLTTHNTHNRQTSMPPVGFEPTISAGERP